MISRYQSAGGDLETTSADILNDQGVLKCDETLFLAVQLTSYDNHEFE